MKPMTNDPDLEGAYALKGTEGAKKLYAEWAQTYDESFAREMAYRLPQAVAWAYRDLAGDAPILDLGAGTSWFEDILVKGQRQYIVEDILKARIRDTEGITDLTSFELLADGERAISVSFAATTLGGVSIEQIVELDL